MEQSEIGKGGREEGNKRDNSREREKEIKGERESVEETNITENGIENRSKVESTWLQLELVRLMCFDLYLHLLFFSISHSEHCFIFQTDYSHDLKKFIEHQQISKG